MLTARFPNNPAADVVSVVGASHSGLSGLIIMLALMTVASWSNQAATTCPSGAIASRTAVAGTAFPAGARVATSPHERPAGRRA